MTGPIFAFSKITNYAAMAVGALSLLVVAGVATELPPARFTSPVAYNSGGGGAEAVAVADVNRDGIPDLVVALQCPGEYDGGCTTSGGKIGVMLGNGDGTFQSAMIFSSGGATADSIAVASNHLLAALIKPEHELLTIIEGDGANPANTRRITEFVSDEYPQLSVEVHHGGQPLYPYYFGVE